MKRVKARCPNCGWESKPFQYAFGWPPSCGKKCGSGWACDLVKVKK